MRRILSGIAGLAIGAAAHAADPPVRPVAIELPAAVRAQVRAATLPVLLPADAALLAGAVVTRGEGWYAASMRGEGVHMSLHGMRRAHVRPHLAAELAKLPAGPRLERVDGIVSVSFERHGASYTLDVECARPLADPRCTGDAFALGVADALVQVGP